MILKFNSRTNPGQDPGYKLEVSIHFYLKNKNQNNFVLIIKKKFNKFLALVLSQVEWVMG